MNARSDVKRETTTPPSPQISRRQLLRNAAIGGAGIAGVSLAGYFVDSLLHSSPSSSVPNVVLRWDNAAIQAISKVRMGPPMVARALAVLHTCMYDAWTVYHPVAIPVCHTGIPKASGHHDDAVKAKAISYAAYQALLNLFPTQESVFTRLMADLGYDPTNATTDIATMAGVGNVCAQAVVAFRYADGANQQNGYKDTTGFPDPYGDYPAMPQPINTPDTINDPNHWQPLRIADGHGGSVVQTYIAPHWGLVIPFALTSGKHLRPSTGPAVVTDPLYAVQAQEIVNFSGGLTDEHKVIALYWKDGPFSAQPPGHWCLFGQYVSLRDHHSLDDDVFMFFALANAMLDASIACWDTKRFYCSVRPITAIHYLYAGKQILAFAGQCEKASNIPGESWQPYQPDTVVTPSFPEYFSGHSTFSAAGAEILKRFTGSDAFGNSAVFKAGGSDVEPDCVPAHDVKLSWATFSDAADQAGISRRYGGIHFSQGDYDGRAAGRQVGTIVWAKAQAYLNGMV